VEFPFLQDRRVYRLPECFFDSFKNQYSRG
jgi:hypothetical protein